VFGSDSNGGVTGSFGNWATTQDSLITGAAAVNRIQEEIRVMEQVFTVSLPESRPEQNGVRPDYITRLRFWSRRRITVARHPWGC
jgi:hypothetical protein